MLLGWWHHARVKEETRWAVWGWTLCKPFLSTHHLDKLQLNSCLHAPLLESHSELSKMNQDRQCTQSRLFCRCSSPGCRGRRYHDRNAFNHAHDHTRKRTLIPCHLLIWLSHSCLDEPEDGSWPYFRKTLAPRTVTIYGKPKRSLSSLLKHIINPPIFGVLGGVYFS